MSERKPTRKAHSDLSREEKDRMNAKKRESRIRKKQFEASLVAIPIQEDSTMLIHRSFTPERSNQRDNSCNDQDGLAGSSQHHLLSVDNIGVLHDVPIGITNDAFVPPPVVRQHVIPSEPYVLPLLDPCIYCSAKRFSYEPIRFCCGQGEVNLYPISIPPYLAELYSGHTPASAHFRKYIRPYNNAFAFTSLGAHLDPQLAQRLNGIFTFRAQGQIYHFINGLIPTNQKPSFLQLYFYDTEHEVRNRIGLKGNLDEKIIQELIHVLVQNPYSIFFRSLREVSDLDTCQITLKANPKVHGSTTNVPHVSQVGAIWYENQDSPEITEREIMVYKHDGHSQKISYYYGCYDPLQYPLLFPCGEPGWHQGIKKNKRTNISAPSEGQRRVNATSVISVEDLLANEAAAFQQTNEGGSMISARQFYAYRFQIRPAPKQILLRSGRLLQQFIVDIYIKIETSRLDYFRHHQHIIRADLYQGIVDSVRQGEAEGANVGKRIILPGSFIGGPRDMRKRFLDAMALVEHYGKPDLFLTMTCNPNWPEIKNELETYEEAQNRPDLLTRVFRSKFEQLRKEVIKEEIFGPIAAYTYVIEFQKRGLPHAHMLIILKRAYKLITANKFDAFISAEIPDKTEQPHLYAMVTRHMMHGPCGKLNMQNPCMEKDCCRNNYPRSYCSATTISDDGYPLYKRRESNNPVLVRGHMLDNRWVVPYNPYLLARFDCHINVEACSTIKAVKYLYKYIYKGHDKVIYKLVAAKDNEITDEIEQFQSARWISPPEAAWRIYKFPLYDMHPAVIILQLHLEGFHTVSFQDNTDLHIISDNNLYAKTMLTEFFWMNAHDAHAKQAKLLYKDFPTQFVWFNSGRIWKLRKRGEVIGRIITANPSQGEQYYLRLLLNYVPGPTSYMNLRTVDGVVYNSNREAALAYGLLEDDSDQKQCMQGACLYEMPCTLRQLFCIILVHCSPSNPKELFERFEDPMADDYTTLQQLGKQEARQHLLHALSSTLRSMGKNLGAFQLSGLLASDPHETAIPREIADEMNLPISEADLATVSLLNREQQNAYNSIMEAVCENQGKSFFIDGPGGTGKTFLYRALLATIRSQGKIALATASSGVAASILPNGRTAHSKFKIPIESEGKLSCNIGKQSATAQLLKQAVLIIWDEAPMAKKEIIEALDTALRDITTKDLLFGGKIVVFGGDFRQVLPVIPKGTKEDCINASLVRSALWKQLTKLQLKENMRAKEDPAYSEYILRIGDGTEATNRNSQIKIPPYLLLQPTTLTPSLDDLIQFVFPSLQTYPDDPLRHSQSAILTPKNHAVEAINDVLISKFPGKEQIYLSINETEDPTQQGTYIDYLNTISSPSIPPHRLVLKKGCPILLLRNINPSQGLCNGTRLICKDFQKHVIVAQIAAGDKQGTEVFIPRIPLKPSHGHQYPVQFTRKQYPIRLCFGMTINKAQGQTLNTVGIYLPEPVFSHGQLYVALSRATSAAKIKVQIQPTNDDPLASSHTENIVYKEVLLEATSS